jgi:calcineurin-like phosphoesterase family protein
MNVETKKDWNKNVGNADAPSPSDTVIYGGDVAMTGEPEVSANHLDELNGQKMLILGNHDKHIDAEIFPYPCVEHTVIQNQGYRFWYTHNPEDVPSHWNQWILHGHVHNNEPFIRYDQKKINVSVECLNYKPISLRNIVEILKRLSGGDIIENIDDAPDI